MEKEREKKRKKEREFFEMMRVFQYGVGTSQKRTSESVRFF
jgi:hypothetical protein